MIPNSLETAIYGLVSTPALQLADRHGILRRLIDDGPAPAAALAEGAGVDPDTTDRLLLVLVAVGVVELDADGRYLLPAAVAPYLDARDPRYIGEFVEHLIALARPAAQT